MLKADLTDKVALITGGGSGIGRAICLEFAKAKAQVACVDIDRERGIETVDLVNKVGGEAVYLTADVTDATDVRKYVQDTMSAYGRIDAFANNAGFAGVIQPIVEYPEQQFDRVMAINVRGVFLGLKYVLPVMIEQGSGAVVNTGSTGSFVGSQRTSAYNASKHAVMGLTRCAALEVARQGVRVNAVCPGGTDTEMIQSIDKGLGPEGVKKILDAVPDGRRATPEEVARWIVFLCSDMASHITGQSLVIDGGYLAS